MTPIKNDAKELKAEWDKPSFGNIPLTENQRKVINDKYLRDDPSVENWLWNIAKNIALAELLYHPEISREQVLAGVRNTQEWVDVGNAETSELLLIHTGAKTHNEQDANHQRFIQNRYNLLEHRQ